MLLPLFDPANPNAAKALTRIRTIRGSKKKMEPRHVFRFAQNMQPQTNAIQTTPRFPQLECDKINFTVLSGCGVNVVSTMQRLPALAAECIK